MNRLDKVIQVMTVVFLACVSAAAACGAAAVVVWMIRQS